MALNFQPLKGWSAHVMRLQRVTHLPAPENQPFAFVYEMLLKNDSAETLTIFARKWMLRDALGNLEVVEGDGVVGARPRLSPGEEFSYNSYHTIATRSEVVGSFFARTDGGAWVVAHTEPFVLEPSA